MGLGGLFEARVGAAGVPMRMHATALSRTRLRSPAPALSQAQHSQRNGNRRRRRAPMGKGYTSRKKLTWMAERKKQAQGGDK